MGVDPGGTLALCMRAPRVVSIAICLPICVTGEQVVLVGESVIHARVILIVDATSGLLNDVVVDSARLFRSRIGCRKDPQCGLVKAIGTDYVESPVALKLRISRLTLIIDGWQTGCVKITRQLSRGRNCGRHQSS